MTKPRKEMPPIEPRPVGDSVSSHVSTKHLADTAVIAAFMNPDGQVKLVLPDGHVMRLTRDMMISRRGEILIMVPESPKLPHIPLKKTAPAMPAAARCSECRSASGHKMDCSKGRKPAPVKKAVKAAAKVAPKKAAKR